MATSVLQCAAALGVSRARAVGSRRVSPASPLRRETRSRSGAISASRPVRLVRAAATANDPKPPAKTKAGDAGKKGAGKKDDDKDGESKKVEARKALMRALEKGEPVSGRVEVANRGGLILRIFNGRFRAFLPLSQMTSSRTLDVKRSRKKNAPKSVTAPLASFDDDEDLNIAPLVAAEPKETSTKDATVAVLEAQVGKVIEVKVTDVNDKKIVVSERALVQERGVKRLKPGVRASAQVVSLSDFGAFVELSQDDPQAPRLEGLIHISELSWSRVAHPRDVLRVGDEVDVKVLDVAPAEGRRPARVTFSLKQLQADPLLETLDTIMPVAMPEPSVDEDELGYPAPGPDGHLLQPADGGGHRRGDPGEAGGGAEGGEPGSGAVADQRRRRGRVQPARARGTAGSGDPRGDEAEQGQHQDGHQARHQRAQVRHRGWG